MKRWVAFFLTLVLCLQSLLGTGVPQAVALQAQQDAAWQQMVDKVASANAAQPTGSGSGSERPSTDGAATASASAQSGDTTPVNDANKPADNPAAVAPQSQRDPQPRSWDGATDNLVLSDAALSFDGTLSEQAKGLTDDQRASGNLPAQLKATLDVSAALNPAAATGRDGSHAHDVPVAGDSFTVALPGKIMADLQATALRRDGSALKLDAFQLNAQGKPTSVKVAEAVVTPGALNVKVVAPVDTATGKAVAMPGQLRVRFQIPVLVDAALAGEKASQLTWALQVVPNGQARESKLAIPSKADLLTALGIEAKAVESAQQPADKSDADASGSAPVARPTSDGGSSGVAQPTSDAASAGAAQPTSDGLASAGAAQPTADAPAQPEAAETPATVIRPGNRDGAPGVNGSAAEFATFTTLWADNNDGGRPSADQLTKDNEYQLTFSLPGDNTKHHLTEADGLTVTKEATEKLGITQAYFDQYIKKDGHGPVTVKQTGTNTYTASVDPVLPSGAWTYTQRRDSAGNLMWEKNEDGSFKLDASGNKIPVYEDATTKQEQISWYIDHVKQGDGYNTRYQIADAATYPKYVTANQKECLQLLKDVKYTVIAKLGNDNDGGKLLNTDTYGQDAELKWASNQKLTVEKATGGDADKDWGTGKSEDLSTLVKNGDITITSTDTDGQTTATYTAKWPAYHPDGTPFMYSLTQSENKKEYTEDYSQYLPNAKMTFYDYKQVWYNNSESPDHGIETGKLYEGGTMTVTNAGTTPFYGMKQWLDDDPSKRPETTYTLWRYAAKPDTTSAQAAQVTDQNGEYISLTRSAKDNANQKDKKEYISVELIDKYMSKNMAASIQFAKYDQDGYPYIYLLRETVPDGYERLFSKNGKTVDGADNSAGDGEFADHRPSYYDHDFNVVTPTDIWSGGADSTRPVGDVSSYHNNVIINRRVGTTEVTQTKTWKVGSFQDQLKDVTVTFQAERLPAADVDLDANDMPTAKPGKTWEKVPAADGGVKTVTDWSQEKLTQSVTGTFTKYDENGKPYVYRWVESNVTKPGQQTGFAIIDETNQTSRFTLTLKDENGVDQKLIFTGTYDAASKTIVNRYEDTTTAKVDKYWGDGKGGYTQNANPYPADSPYQVPEGGIKVQLFQNDTLIAADDKVDTFTLDGKVDAGEGRAITLKVGEKNYTAHAVETKPWHLEFTDLPKYDADGSKYNYTVVETGTAGFTVSRTIDTDANVTKIYNTPVGAEGSLTDIRITKDWVDGGNSSARLPIKVDLYAKQDLYASNAADAQPIIKAGAKINEQSIELNDENNWYYIARLTVYYVKGTDGKLKPIDGVDMLADAFRIQEVDSDDYEVLTREQVQQRVADGTSAYTPVLENWTDDRPRMFPKDKDGDGTPDDGYVYEVTYGVNREKGSLEVTNRRLGLVNIEIDKTWKDGKFPGNRPASQFTITAKNKAVTFSANAEGRIIATGANGGGTYPLSKIGADADTLEPLTNKDASISKDGTTLTITVDPTPDHSEYEVYGLPKYDGEGFVIEYGTDEDITGQAGDYVSSLTDSDEAYSSWWHFSDQLNYSYENRRTGTKDVTFHTIWYDQYVKKVLNQRPDVYLTLYKRVLAYDKDGNTVDANGDGQPDYTLEKVTGYEDYQWQPQNEVNNGKTDGNYYQQATIRNLPKYDEQGREIVYYATAATNVTGEAVDNLDYQAHYITDEQAGMDADGKPVSDEVQGAAAAGVVDQALQGQQPADQQGKPGTNARGYAARESSTFDFKISNEIKGEGTKIWSNVPGIVDEADLPDISVYLQRRLADEDYPNTYPNSTPAGWSDPSVTNVDSNKKTYSVKTYADDTDKDKAEIQDGSTVLAWTHKVVKTGDHTYTYKFTNYGDNTAINSGGDSKGSSSWPAGTADPEVLPRYDQYGRRYEYRTREVIDGLIDWAAVGAAAEIPGGVKFSDLEKGASESLYQKVYDVTHGETTSFSMANVYKPNQGKLTVKKVYPGDNRAAGDAFPDVTFHLYRYYIKYDGTKSNAQLVQTKVLAGGDVTSEDGGVTGSGKVTFDNVDIYAPNGQYWVYYVTEDKINGYDGAAAMGDVAVGGSFGIAAKDGVVTSGDLATVPQKEGEKYGNPTGTTVADDDTVDVTFKNTYKPDKLTLTNGNKQWGDHQDVFSTRPSIADFQRLITLKRVGSKQKNETVTFSKYIQQHKADNPNDPNDTYDKGPGADPLTDSNLFVWRQYGSTDDNWYFEILNLEVWAPDGTPWKYTVAEKGSDQLLTGPCYSNNNSNGGYDKGTSGDTTTGSANIGGSWFNDLRGRVSVSKVWTGDNEQLRPASVTMQLQARKKGSTENWNYAGAYWQLLVPDAKKGSISETSPISTSMELTAQNGWTASREKLPVKIGNTEIEYRVVETKIGDKDVKVNNDGTYTNAPGANKTGKDFVYSYATEGENTSKQGSDKTDGFTEGWDTTTAKVTNTLQSTSLKVTKTWRDENNAWGTRASATFKLQRKVGYGAWAWVVPTGAADASEANALSVTIEADADPAEATFEGLPKYDPNGDEYAYRAVEVLPTGYTLEGGVAVEGSADTQAAANDGSSFTNKLETVGLTGTKKWEVNGNTSAIPDALDLTLRRKVAGGAYEDVAIPDALKDKVTFTWEKSNDKLTWTYTITGLPKYDANGNEYIYNVRETVPAGFSSSVAAGDTVVDDKTGNQTAPTITNTLKTGSVSLTKVDSNDANTTLNGAVFTLQKQGTDGKSWTDLVTGLVTGRFYEMNDAGTALKNDKGSDGQTGVLSITGLALGTYRFVETAAPAGYQFDSANPATSDEFTIAIDNSDVPQKLNNVTNTSNSFTLDKVGTVSKDGSENVSLNGVTIELVKDGKTYARWTRGDDGKVSATVWSDGDSNAAGITSSDGSITGLPAGTYDFKEIAVPGDYVKTATMGTLTLDAAGKVTVTPAQDLPEGASLAVDASGAKVTLTDPVVKGSLKLTKTLGTDKDAPVLPGVTFDLYRVGADGTDEKIATGLVTDKDGVIDTAKSTATMTGSVAAYGRTKLSDGLLPGSYYFRETATTSGAVLPTDDAAKSATLAIPANGGDAGTLVPTASATMANTPFSAAAQLTKVEAGLQPAPINGAVFKLEYQAPGSASYVTVSANLQSGNAYGLQWDADGKLLPSQVQQTASAGVLKFTNLKKGSYKLTETSNAGYEVPAAPSNPITFTVVDANNGKTIQLGNSGKLANTRKLGSASLKKTGKDGITLNGVTFKLQVKQGDTWKDTGLGDLKTGKSYDAGGKTNAAASEVTGSKPESGVLSVKSLPWGIYRFIETATLPGYSTTDANGQPIASNEFTIDRNTVEQNAALGKIANVYDASGSIEAAGTKVVSGPDNSDRTDDFAEKFSFTLTGKDGAPVRVAGEGGKLETKDSLTAKNAEDGSVSFGELQYKYSDIADATPAQDGSRSKKFSYQVTESGSADGVTNDKDATKTFTVTVTDDGSGKLKVTSDPADSTKLFEFTNTYAPGTATAKLKVSKTLNGRDWRDGDAFTFNLTADSSNPDGATLPTTTTADVTNASADHTATFDVITFTKPGTFKFQISEQKGSAGGIDYDGSSKTVTVTVKDDVANGKLAVESVKYGDDAKATSAPFTNTYKTTAASDSFSFQKVLTGRALKVDEFSFELQGLDGAPMPAGAVDSKVTVKNGADGTVSFGPITYDKVGTYKYKVKELNGSLGGVTYDSGVYDVTVTVTDDGAGALYASHSITRDGTPVADDAAVFNNAYKPGSTSVNLTASKTLTGRDLKADEFSFQVKEGDRVVVSATNGADGKITFPAITYAAAGEHDYVISEVKSDLPGMQYDDASFNVHVSVTDDGKGSLKASVTYDGGAAPNFTNTYQPSATSAELHAQKILTGRDWQQGDSFNFKLEAVGGTLADGKTPIDKGDVPMPQDAKDGVIERVVTDGNEFGFGSMAFNKAGTYLYNISEVVPTSPAPGMSYSADIYRATVTVTDDGKGQLVSSVAMEKLAAGDAGKTSEVKAAGDPVASFTNTYNQLSQTWAPAVTKNYDDHSGANPMTAGKFTFRLTALDGAPLPESAKGDSVGATNTEAGTVTFPAITFTDNNLAADGSEKTYHYEITEVAGNETGMTYDSTVYDADVTVSLENGALKVSPVIKKRGSAEAVTQLTFSNTYAPASADVRIKAHKTLTGAALADKQFSFNLYEGKVSSADGAKLLDKQANDATGDVVFKNLTFDRPGTYAYTIAEVVPADAQDGMKDGVKYDTAWKHVTVEVTLNEATGKFEAKVTGDVDASGSVQFTNTYTPGTAEAQLTATKTLNGVAPAEGRFSFELYAASADGNVAEGAKPLQTKKNDGSGDVSFDKINGLAPGTYHYVIREVDDHQGGVTYDRRQVKVTVIVTDDGKGAATAAVTYDGSADAPTFANTYAPASASDSLVFHKTLTGRNLKPGEFSFELQGFDGAPMPEGVGNGKATVRNAADGSVSFGEITYDKAGTYKYTVKEVAGSLGGVTYDSGAYDVTVTVTDNGGGALQASHAISRDGKPVVDGGAVFNNAYTPGPASASLTASKVLTGKQLKADEFSFQVKEGDKIVAEAKNAAGGTVTFPAVAYTEAGEHDYVISEVKGSESGVTYDVNAYKAHVSVTDSGDGALKAVVTYDGGKAPVFKNAYDASGSIGVAGTKAVIGSDGSDLTSDFADRFTFTLTGVDGAPLRVAGKGGELEERESLTAKNVADGSVSLGELRYVLSDLADVKPEADGSRSKTFTYRVAESDTAAGVTNDKDSTKSFTVTVTDDGSGKLDVKSDPEDASKLFAFTNSYEATGSLALTGTKTMSGRALTGADVYTFNVYEGDKAAGTPVSTGTSDASGKITFDKPLSYTLGDVGRHAYTVAEDASALPGGVSAVTKTRSFTVDVSDADHNGKLRVTATGLGEGSSVDFENAYTPASTTAALQVSKELTGRDWRDGDAFTFDLKADPRNPDGAVLPARTTADVTDATAGHTAAFDAITFTKAGTYAFHISEQTGSAGGMAYDKTEKTATVVVTDDGKGALHAAVTYDGGADAAPFTNIYAPGTASVRLRAAKTLNDVAPADGRFRFELYAAGADGKVAEGAKPLQTKANAADGSVAFDEISGLTPGTYHYVIREVDDHQGGVTYDKRQVKVVVTVTDDGYGKATAAVSYDGKSEAPTFENTYTPGSTSVTLSASKTLTGRDLKAGEFSFQVKEGDKVVAEAENGADGTVAFPAITYVEAGEHDYAISEVAGSEPGVAYDGASHKAHVSVTDDGSGALKAAVTYEDGKVPTFVNAYKPSSVNDSFSFRKALTGRDLKAEEFSFELTGKDGAPMPAGAIGGKATAKNTADGAVSFGSIAYDKAGTYEYTVREVAGGVPGVSYDSTAYDVAVKVADDGKGALHASHVIKRGGTVVAEKDAVFNNSYTPGSVSVSLGASKTLTGRELRDGEFTFRVTEAGKVVAEAANAADGTVAFPAISYKEAGEHDYVISEVAGSEPGVTYDGAPHKAHVSVTDDGSGALKAAVTYEDGKAPTFNNTYTPGTAEAQLVVSKTLDGQAPAEGRFNFELYASDADGKVAEGAKPLQTARNAADGTVSFAKLTGLTPGDHYYVIREVNDHQGGVAYDHSSKLARVRVTDDGKGGATAEVTYDGKAEAPAFRNTYSPAAASDSFAFHKSLTGRDLKAGEFSFELQGLDGAPMPAGAKDGKATVQNGADGSVSFGEITYDKAGAYTYTVREVPGGVPGVSYDPSAYTVTVKVTDDGKGALQASHAITRDGKPVADKDAVFANTYTSAPATASVKVSKALTGRDWRDGDEFTFELKADPGNPEGAALPDPATAVVTGVSTDHTAAFGDIKFSKPGTFKFLISEKPGSAGGIGYDRSVKTVTVKVSYDSRSGKLSVGSISYDGGADSASFTNTYKPAAASDSFTFHKSLTGRDLREGEFSFELQGLDGAPMPAGSTEGKAVAKNGADGTISFGGISYDKAGTYVYTMREVAGSSSGVAYDSTAYTVTVTVTDDGRGALQASHAITRDGQPVADKDTVFTNSYKPGTTSVVLAATKTLTGRQLKAGEFSFQVREGDKVVAEAQNGADGTVSFPAIAYAEAGEHDYTISEVRGSEPGVTYDAAAFDVHVSVTDNGDGTLKSAATYPKGGAAFTNSYAPSPANISIPVQKVISGRDWRSGDSFSFQLSQDPSNLDGTVLPASSKVVINEKTTGHRASFAPITFTEAGNYRFQVRELGASHDGLAYDRSVKTVTVTVADDGKGALHATLAEGSVTPVFTNFYVPKSHQIRIHKVDEDGKSLSGAGFTVEGSFADGTSSKTVTTDASGFASIPMLVASGEYRVRETVAPAGYERVDGELVFSASDDGSIKFAGAAPEGFALDGSDAIRVVNRKTALPPSIPPRIARVLPQTGDPVSTFGLYAITALGMASLAAGLRGLRRRMGER